MARPYNNMARMVSVKSIDENWKTTESVSSSSSRVSCDRSTLHGGCIRSNPHDVRTLSTNRNETQRVFSVREPEASRRWELVKREPHKCLLSSWKQGKWEEVAKFVKDYPYEASRSLSDGNNRKTTILHKALSSKDIDLESRISLVKLILQSIPWLSKVKNHHGSLPLHVAARNIGKMGVDGDNNRCIISNLIKAFPNALLEGDAMGHTPLHVACEKWCSSRIAALLLDAAPEAASIKDKKNWLPIHIACSRRCSPKKAKLLLDASPFSIFAKTNDGETPLTIAVKTSSPKNPQSALIRELSVAFDENGSRGVKRKGEILLDRGRDERRRSTETHADQHGEFVVDQENTTRSKRARKSDMSGGSAQHMSGRCFDQRDNGCFRTNTHRALNTSRNIYHPRNLAVFFPDLLLLQRDIFASERRPRVGQFRDPQRSLF